MIKRVLHIILFLFLILGCANDTDVLQESIIYDKPIVIYKPPTIDESRLPPPYARGENIFYGNPEFRYGYYQEPSPTFKVHYTGDGKTPETAWNAGYGIYRGIKNNDTLYLANVNWNTATSKFRDEYPYYTHCVIDSMYVWIRKKKVDVSTGESIHPDYCNCQWEEVTDTIYFQWYDPPPEDRFLYYPYGTYAEPFSMFKFLER